MTKVLVVSHNVFSHTTAMGKTLTSYFSSFGSGAVAQFYIHSEVPTDRVICKNYYRFTDTDALKARLPFIRRGVRYGEGDIRQGRVFSRTDEGLKARAYQRGRKRTAGIYFLRNLVWKTACWKTPEFRKWIRDFDPDIVFFASGDYAFMYDIARYAADEADCPLVISCMDDYYLKNPGPSRFAQRVHASFMKDVRKAMNRADLIVCMCDEMSRAYQQMFDVEARTLYTGVNTDVQALPEDGERHQISFIGNIGALRLRPLLEIGEALSAIGKEGVPDHIDIYSQERNPDILRELSDARGIVMHGPVPTGEVPKVMERSLLVVHVESMEPLERNPARYSISTKIPESLTAGPCLFAYGPEGLASIDYLKRNQAAYVVTSKDDLREGLTNIIGDPAMRKRIVGNARRLAQTNHTEESVGRTIKSSFQRAAENYSRRNNKRI